MTAPACGSCTAPVNDGYLCSGCTRDLASLLLTAANIAGDLDDAIAKLLKRGSGGPRSETEAPLPFDLAASEVADRLHRYVAYWAHEINRTETSWMTPVSTSTPSESCSTSGDSGSPATGDGSGETSVSSAGRSAPANGTTSATPSTDGSPNPSTGPATALAESGATPDADGRAKPQYGTSGDATTAGIARWLVARLGRLRQHPDAARILREIRHSVRDALAVIDRAPERSPAGQCEQCGSQLLAELGADEVTCGCGMLVTALNDRRRERAAAADVLGTAAEISAVLATMGIRLPRGTITSWASRNRLGARGKSGMYALSDVLALHAQSQARLRG